MGPKLIIASSIAIGLSVFAAQVIGSDPVSRRKRLSPALQEVAVFESPPAPVHPAPADMVVRHAANRAVFCSHAPSDDEITRSVISWASSVHAGDALVQSLRSTRLGDRPALVYGFLKAILAARRGLATTAHPDEALPADGPTCGEDCLSAASAM